MQAGSSKVRGWTDATLSCWPWQGYGAMQLVFQMSAARGWWERTDGKKETVWDVGGRPALGGGRC